MPTVTVIYPRSEGATFDFDYYERTHLPLVAARWGDAGLTGAEALRGVGAADGGAPDYLAIALISFDSADSMRAAMTGPHIGEIAGDIPNFTNVQPAIQINERIG
ncbi:MAG: EthD family reductase [Allosphingosinicella sp.]